MLVFNNNNGITVTYYTKWERYVFVDDGKFISVNVSGFSIMLTLLRLGEVTDITLHQGRSSIGFYYDGSTAVITFLSKYGPNQGSAIKLVASTVNELLNNEVNMLRPSQYTRKGVSKLAPVPTLHANELSSLHTTRNESSPLQTGKASKYQYSSAPCTGSSIFSKYASTSTASGGEDIIEWPLTSNSFTSYMEGECEDTLEMKSPASYMNLTPADIETSTCTPTYSYTSKGQRVL